jgi:hypothetical protein
MSRPTTPGWGTGSYHVLRMGYGLLRTGKQSSRLVGPIGPLDMFVTRSALQIADQGMQICGGRGLAQAGMGRNMEPSLVALRR